MMETVRGDYRASDHNQDYYRPPMEKAAPPLRPTFRGFGAFVWRMTILALGLGGIVAGVVALGELLHR